MKIAGIDLFKLSCPLAHAVRMSTGRVDRAETLLVRVASDHGLQGWGEAAAAPSMTGETLDGMYAGACYLAPHLLGLDGGDLPAFHREMNRRLPGNHALKAALDIALHDLLGRHRGLPVSRLLGERRRERVHTLALLGEGSLDADVNAARAMQAGGYRAFKLKVGAGGLEEDIARALAVRAALGASPQLSADANGAWSPAEAARFLAGAAAARLDFLEQPVAPEALGEAAGLFAAHGVPIGLDESLRSFEDLRRAHAAGWAQGGSFKLIKLGGMRQLVEATRAASDLGCQVNLAGKVAETGIATAALLQAAAVSPSLDWGCSPSHVYLAKDVVTPALDIRQGVIDIPAAPGLGITVDEAAVRKHALDTREITRRAAA